MEAKLIHQIENGLIWRIIFNEENPNIILVEIREQILWQTKFVILDITQNIFSNFVLEESWWITPVFFDNKHIFFYFYANSEKPIPTELWTYDYAQNKIIQKTNDIRIDFLTNKKEKKSLFFETFYYQENEEYFDTLKKFIEIKSKNKDKDNDKTKIIKNIAYIEMDNFLVINYFSVHENIYTENLWITDKKGNIIEKKVFEIAENFYIGERIYIQEKKLIYIKQKTTIYIYAII
ncbi:MAG: DUF4905 domain-containing protein [Bacteroidetes bacterium]|nr:MAG: DUF4905 domain-containing protein [Bacteroidota bacterium]TAG87215.1 MAG: DUF4905 domain-containing protein [Bacteroidota bacterium]